MAGQYRYPKYEGMVSGLYKLTDDFEAELYGTRPTVRDVNFFPNDGRLPCLAICRVYSTREDAEIILDALNAAAGKSAAASALGSIRTQRKAEAARRNGRLGGRPKKQPTE